MKHLFWILTSFCSTAMAAPFIISDDTDQEVTHCGVLLDSAEKVDVPVTATKSCKYDVGSVAVGSHSIRFTYVAIVPGYGRSESEPSAPFTFIRPPATIQTSPSGLQIIP